MVEDHGGGARGQPAQGHADAEVRAQLRAAMVDHYHQSFELAYRIWERRNSAYAYAIFFFFITTVVRIDLSNSAAVVLTLFSPTELDGLAPQIRGYVNSTASGALIATMGQFSLDLISIYFLATLYQRESHLKTMYAFVSDMEADLRDEFKLPPKQVAFSRESDYYRRNNPRGLSTLFTILFSAALFFVVAASIIARFMGGSAFGGEWLIEYLQIDPALFQAVATAPTPQAPLETGPSPFLFGASLTIGVVSSLISAAVLIAYLRLNFSRPKASTRPEAGDRGYGA